MQRVYNSQNNTIKKKERERERKLEDLHYITSRLTITQDNVVSE